MFNNTPISVRMFWNIRILSTSGWLYIYIYNCTTILCIYSWHHPTTNGLAPGFSTTYRAFFQRITQGTHLEDLGECLTCQNQYIIYTVHTYIPGWWFQTFFIFHNIWDNPSHWLILFKMVKTPTRYCGWKKSCTTLHGWNPINNGINHL